MNTLAHLTLNTGHCRMSPRSEVWDQTIRALDGLVAAGGGHLPVPMDGMMLKIGRNQPGRAALRIGDEKGEYVIGALVWEEDAADIAWPALAELARAQSADTGERLPALTRPTTLPWLALMLAPPAALLDPETLMMLGDMERCIAWTILAQEGLAI